MTEPDRLRRRRCLGLRIAVFFAVVFAVYYRDDWVVVAVFAAGGLLAAGAFWRDCRPSAPKPEQSDTHAREFER
jgi:hypothetical protein